MFDKVRIKQPSLLAKLFTSSFMNMIIEDKHIDYMQEIFKVTAFDNYIKEGYSVQSALNSTFKYLKSNYRCEYVFKTAILNELLLKRHNFDDVAYLTEFRAYNTKADIVILNGTSTVYEIKSDIDKLDRLLSQTSVYQKIFDKAFVVSNDLHLPKIKSIVSSNIGLLNLNNDLSVDIFREAKSNLETLDKALMFDSLRKAEYLNIIQEAFGYIPNVPGTLIHSECKNLFSTLSNKKAHNFFLNALKLRQLSENQIKLLKTSSIGLKGLLSDKYYSKDECKIIKFGLNQKLTASCISPTSVLSKTI